MKINELKKHLQPYSILGRRRTTISHAFASAIAPVEVFDETKVRASMRELGQDPDEPLVCVYCDAPAETWDHVLATVSKGEFSGAGHELANLVPCCKSCNSKKGNKHWRTFIHERKEPVSARELRVARLASHLSGLSRPKVARAETERDYAEYQAIRGRILDLMKQADELAARIREATKNE